MLNVPHIERIVVNERKKYYILYMGAKGMIYVIKKDGTREEFNSQKIVAAVNKSAARIYIHFRIKRRNLSASLRKNMRRHWERMR